jgi:hypothetical protein
MDIARLSNSPTSLFPKVPWDPDNLLQPLLRLLNSLHLCVGQIAPPRRKPLVSAHTLLMDAHPDLVFQLPPNTHRV